MEEPPKKFTRNIYQLGQESVSFPWENSSDAGVELSYWAVEKVFEEENIDFKKQKVLEIGSGNGKFLDYAKSKGVNITGIDINPRSDKNSPQVLGRIEQLPFKDGSFDVVYGAFVFDQTVYVQNQNLMLEEVKRVLKVGGHLIVPSVDFVEPKIKGLIRLPSKDYPQYTLYQKTS